MSERIPTDLTMRLVADQIQVWREIIDRDQTDAVDAGTARSIIAAYDAQRAVTRHLLDLVSVVQEALNIPHAATVGHEETRNKIFMTRTMHVAAALNSLLDPSRDPDLVWEIGFLRDQLAKHPATGYVTNEQANAALAEGKSWSEAVALSPDDDEAGGGPRC